MPMLWVHILADFEAVASDILNDPALLESALREAASAANTTVLGSAFHHFEPQGVTGILLLSESHVSIHTWPEHGSAAIDFFSCSPFWAQKGIEVLRKTLGGDVRIRVLDRGIPESPFPLRTLSGGWKMLVEADAIPTSSITLPVDRVLFEETNHLQSLRIFDTGTPLGRAMDIDGAIMLTERDEAFFHEMLVHVPAGARFRDGEDFSTENVLVIGGGDWGTVRELCKYPEIRSITVCDYDERVVRRSQEFFPKIAGSFSDPRVRLIFRDAIAFTKELPDQAYDLIIIDGTLENELLLEGSFFSQILRILGPNGRISAFAGTPVSDFAAYAKNIETLRRIFPFAEPYLGFVPMYDTGCWGNVLLARREIDLGSFADLPTGEYRYVAPGVREAAFVLPSFARVRP